MGGERMVYGEEKGHTAARGRASHTAVLRCGANLVWRLADALAKEHLPEVLRHLGALVALVCAVDGLARLAKVKAAGVVGGKVKRQGVTRGAKRRRVRVRMRAMVREGGRTSSSRRA